MSSQTRQILLESTDVLKVASKRTKRGEDQKGTEDQKRTVPGSLTRALSEARVADEDRTRSRGGGRVGWGGMPRGLQHTDGERGVGAGGGEREGGAGRRD